MPLRSIRLLHPQSAGGFEPVGDAVRGGGHVVVGQIEPEHGEDGFGDEAVEERARSELGLIKPGETFYQVVEPDNDAPKADDGR